MARSPDKRRQQGIALVVALLLLVVVTLVGLAAVGGTLLQQKMAANFYDREIAFQADEAALRQAENAILASTAAPPGAFRDCSPGSGNVCLANPFDDPHLPGGEVTQVGKASFDARLAASQPQYVIEYMGNFAVPVPNVKQLSSCSGYVPCSAITTADFYRITARSGDPAQTAGRAQVVLQSVYRK